jgi:N-acetylglucosamine-6-phosphate deacetylase
MNKTHLAPVTAKMQNNQQITMSGRRFPDGLPITLQVENGWISRMESSYSLEEPEDTQRWIVPGFFDLQVNGFAGKAFTDPDIDIDDVMAIAHALFNTGVTHFLPTVITADLQDMCHQLSVIARTMQHDPLVKFMCLGIHVEGPFLNPEDGPRGAHPREHVRPPNWEDFARLQEAAEGKIALLTVAPEQPDATELIRQVTERNVLVALGHHRADPAAMEKAIEAGAKLCTHLGNGSDAMLPRVDNIIWRQLAEDRLWASFIADGHHLPGPTLRSMLRAKTTGRSILITDAVAAAGMPPGQYQLGTTSVERTPNGKVVLPGTPYQAGSGADMPHVIDFAIRQGGLSLPEVVELVTLQPARLMNMPLAEWRCETNESVELVELDWHSHGIDIRQVAAGQFSVHLSE